ncbi:MAG: hypothetical protein J6I65_06770 [Lachnospiraceae bacterium]|nr:hypothetical protein [Lachnospiraceae bacterium]
MAGTSYVRKVIYFSEYQKRVMKGNAGFGRLEVSGGQLKVHISVKASDKQINWKGYGYLKNGSTLQMIFLGDLKRESTNWVLTTGTKADNIKGSGISFEKLKGLLVLDGEEHYLAEVPLGDVTFNYLKTQGMGQRFEPKPELKPIPDLTHVEEMPEEVPKVVAAEETVFAETVLKEPVEKAEADIGQKLEQEPPQTSETAGSWGEKLLQRLPEMYPFEDDELDKCVRLEPKDFGHLPAGEWQAAKNTFLLEGYYEYRHIIFALKRQKGQEKFYLGVPGTFHRRECFLANMFGFPYFKGIQNKENTAGDFGYWFRELS